MRRSVYNAISRGLIRQYRRGRGCLCRAVGVEFDAIDAHWPLDVIEALLPAIDEVGRHLALHLPPGVLGNRDTAGFGDALDTSRDIHAIAKNVVALDDDVADVDANSELDRIGFMAGALLKLSLNFDGAGNRIKGAA
jgi:hypothetical protein